MARYQIILAYDGTHFLGSQRQAASRTVQGELERALCKIGWDGKTVYLAGRTDTGTHAIGQVAAFDLNWVHGLESLHKALNAHLPNDMAVRQVFLAADNFHPRFDARSRTYRYRLFCAEVRDPLRERYNWRVWPAVTDLEPLAAILLGRHDFRAFGTPPRANGSTMRTVFSANWKRNDDEWTFDIQADAYLYRMVRKLVYVQVAVGQGKIPVDTLVGSINNDPDLFLGSKKGGQSKFRARLAPACGLTLVEVRYDNLL